VLGAGDGRRHEPVGEEARAKRRLAGWFLQAAPTAFIPIAAARKEAPVGPESYADAVSVSLGCRGLGASGIAAGTYYDDGRRLGSASRRRVPVDSIAHPGRGHCIRAGDTAARQPRRWRARPQLVHRGDRLGAALFTPPLTRSRSIRLNHGRSAGLREKGGQYPPGRLAVRLFAALGKGDKAAEMFFFFLIDAQPIQSHGEARRCARYKVEQ